MRHIPLPLYALACSIAAGVALVAVVALDGFEAHATVSMHARTVIHKTSPIACITVCWDI